MGPDNRHTHYAKYCSAIWRVGYLYLFSRTTCSSKLVSLFQNLGTAPIIDEKLMDAATRLAASGTAFASYAYNAPVCRQVLRLANRIGYFGANS
jgi:hypothetical protein